MLRLLREFVKSIPTLVLSLTLAVAVWISAVTAADPVQQRVYPRPITLERRNQSASLVIVNDVPETAIVTLSAPGSIWDEMMDDRAPVLMYIDLAGLDAGTYTLDVKIQLPHQPARWVSYQPRTVEVVLERLATKDLDIQVVRRGEPATGFQAGNQTLSQNTVTVSGPASLVDRVKEVQAVLDLSQATDSVVRALEVQALDENGIPVEGVTLVPEQVTVNQPITRVAGYRNVVVKVSYSGQPAPGYRLTNVSVFPPAVTVFSNNPQLVDSLPGFVETAPLDLTGVQDDIEVRLPLVLPKGVSVSNEDESTGQSVLVQVGVAAIEDSITLSGLAIQVTGLPQGLSAELSPTTVDVIVSGPVLLLDRLTPRDIAVRIDLSNVVAGTYQLAPLVELTISELRVESILPGSIEVTVAPAPTATPTVEPIITPTARPGR